MPFTESSEALATLGGDEKVCVWSDGTSCLFEELHEMSHMSDDYAVVRIQDGEDASDAAHRHIKAEAAYFRSL